MTGRVMRQSAARYLAGRVAEDPVARAELEELLGELHRYADAIREVHDITRRLEGEVLQGKAVMDVTWTYQRLRDAVYPVHDEAVHKGRGIEESDA